MRTFRDAKSMASVLREQLSTRQIPLTRSESLELVARLFGVNDWNTLAAAIKTGAHDRSGEKAPVRTVPAFPIRDATPFPGIEMPFWLRRPETIKALQKARTGGRRIVLLTQRTMDIDSPALADLYEIGVTGRIIDISVPEPEAIERTPRLEGTTQVVVQTHERVRVLAFSATPTGYEAEIADVIEGPMNDSPELAGKALEEFARYARKVQGAARAESRLRRSHDVGRIADIIAHSLAIAVPDKQSLLGTLDPVERLEAVLAYLKAA